jgi:Tfp pilus assembly protein PilN
MHINFIEQRRWKTDFLDPRKIFQQFQWNRLGLVSMAALVLMFMVSYGMVQKIRLDSLQTKLNTTTASLSQLRATSPSLEIPKEVSFYEGIPWEELQNRIQWSKILYQISSDVPSQIRLISIVADLAGIDLEGEARDQRAVAYWIQTLAQDPICSQVQLLSSQEVQEEAPEERQRGFRFKVRCEGF